MLCAFGVDVLDPAVTPRRVWVLGTRLPPWARAGGEEWSAEAHLLALIADHLANLSYITVRVAGDKSAPRPRPMPRPRPRAASAAPARPEPPSGPPGGWAGVARQLAGIPGVISRDG